MRLFLYFPLNVAVSMGQIEFHMLLSLQCQFFCGFVLTMWVEYHGISEYLKKHGFWFRTEKCFQKESKTTDTCVCMFVAYFWFFSSRIQYYVYLKNSILRRMLRIVLLFWRHQNQLIRLHRTNISLLFMFMFIVNDRSSAAWCNTIYSYTKLQIFPIFVINRIQSSFILSTLFRVFLFLFLFSVIWGMFWWWSKSE